MKFGQKALCFSYYQPTEFMLQLRQISRLLAQGLRPVSTSPEHSHLTQLDTAPLSISLLSSEGVALTTVVSTSLLQQLDLTSDNLKIYSLIGYNYLHQRLQDFYKQYFQPSTKTLEIDLEQAELVSWTVVQLENDIKLVIQKLTTDSNHSPPLYVILFYHNSFPDEFAKLKSDNLKLALNEGLKGYTE